MLIDNTMTIKFKRFDFLLIVNMMTISFKRFDIFANSQYDDNKF